MNDCCDCHFFLKKNNVFNIYWPMRIENWTFKSGTVHSEIITIKKVISLVIMNNGLLKTMFGDNLVPVRNYTTSGTFWLSYMLPYLHTKLRTNINICTKLIYSTYIRTFILRFNIRTLLRKGILPILCFFCKYVRNHTLSCANYFFRNLIRFFLSYFSTTNLLCEYYRR